jgi:hypothetical protein
MIVLQGRSTDTGTGRTHPSAAYLLRSRHVSMHVPLLVGAVIPYLRTMNKAIRL